MGRILVIDDEPGVLNAFRDMLAGAGHDVQTASSGERALEQIRAESPDLVVTDLCLPGMSGLDAFRSIRAANPKLPVIIMTGQGTMSTAIEATKIGVFDYQVKPFEPDSMMAAIERGLESVRLMRRSVALNPEQSAHGGDAMIGESAPMQEVFKAIGRVAATDATVLIRGESGTGKELVARALYQHSLRADAPLLVVNCAAIPESLLESELFGHERGAFTSADARRIGKFEQARGATILLDEIGDVSLAVQAKILRVLQQKTFDRLGGSETIHADVRIVAATNRNLESAVSTGTFREDLYHRLNVVTITIVPLRERRGDVPRLVDYFVERYSEELQITRPVVADDALDALCDYDWPGNVRELENCIYRALISTQGFPVQASDVLKARDAASSTASSTSTGHGSANLHDVVCSHLNQDHGPGAHERLVAEVERLLIAEALRRTRGNQSQAAQLLGLARPTLHAKMQRYKIDFRAM